MSPSSPWHFTATLLRTASETTLISVRPSTATVDYPHHLVVAFLSHQGIHCTTSLFPLYFVHYATVFSGLNNLLSNCQYAQSSTVSVHSLCLSTSCRTTIDPIQHRKLNHSLSTTAWDAPPLAAYAQHREFSGGLIGDAIHTQPNRHGGAEPNRQRFRWDQTTQLRMHRPTQILTSAIANNAGPSSTLTFARNAQPHAMSPSAANICKCFGGTLRRHNGQHTTSPNESNASALELHCWTCRLRAQCSTSNFCPQDVTANKSLPISAREWSTYRVANLDTWIR